jgi:putative ABC transport system substrate-binding protein
MRRRARKASCPGLSPQVEFTRLAALNAAELGQARVPVASTSCFVDAANTWMAGPSPAMTERVTNRRAFITLIGAAAAWPLAARAQQQPAMPVIGFLHPTSADALPDRLRGFRQGLKETGYVEGENVMILYRFAENQTDRLSAMAGDLVTSRVAVITAANSPPALAAKAATTTIPIVFITPEDPVRLGLVTSLAKPGGNLTGINLLSGELAAKRLELLRQLVPGAARVVVLVNPANPWTTETTLRDVEAAARSMGLQIEVLKAGTSHEIDAAFATLARDRSDILFVGGDPFFTSRRVQLAVLAAHYSIPSTSATREIAEAGGLMSYGASIPDGWREAGAYVGRILKGAKPADLPVVQSTKFELVINAQTAKTLGLALSPSLLALADEVIE